MRFITAIATAAFVLTGANAASAAPLNTDTSGTIKLSQAKPKESPAVDQIDQQGKKNTPAPSQNQTQPDTTIKPQHPNTGINPSR